MALAEKLKELREKKALSQRDMANILNIPVSSYSNWEKGNEPKIHFLIWLADYFDITVDELIGRANPTPEEQAERDFRLVESWLNKAGFEIGNYSPGIDAEYGDLLYIYPKGWQSMPIDDKKVFRIPKFYFVEFGMTVIADCEKFKEQTIVERMQAFGVRNTVQLTEAIRKLMVNYIDTQPPNKSQ